MVVSLNRPHLAKNVANLRVRVGVFFHLPQTPFQLATFILSLVLSMKKQSPRVFFLLNPHVCGALRKSSHLFQTL